MWYVHVYVGTSLAAMLTTLVTILRLAYRIGALVTSFREHVREESEARKRMESEIRDLRIRRR